MAETNFTFLSGGLDASRVARGTTAGIARPDGGGNYCFGFHSLDESVGAVGLFCNESNFNPLKDDATNDTGGSISGAIKRGVSAGTTGFSPFIFICLQGDSVEDKGYMLGLSDNDPHEIILYKGVLSNGLDPTADGILLTSTEAYYADTWHHLRIDAIVNPNGDLVLNVFESDLDTYAVTSPTWVAIDGMSTTLNSSGFIDDALGVNSGIAGNTDLPYVGGRVGFGFETSAAYRRSYLDQITISRQK